MKKVLFSVGHHGSGTPVEQGRGAALNALSRTGKTPPALAVLVGSDSGQAAELLRGVREVLGACPLIGAVAPGAQPAESRVPGPRLYVIASSHLQAKVGVGSSDDGDWEHEAREAFKGSYVASPVPDLPDDAPEHTMYRWYLYRRPSLLLALIVSRPGERESRERQVAAFLKHRLGGRVPILMHSIEAGAAGPLAPVALADGRVVPSGVVLAMIKTDLRFTLERIGDCAPGGGRLVIARAEGDRIVDSPFEIPCGPEFSAHLPPSGEAVTGHLQLALHRELDPIAVAAAENERLLRQVVQLKDLHQRIFDGIGFGIALVDADRRIVLSNNTHWELLGTPAGGTPTPDGVSCPWSCGDDRVCGTCSAGETIERNAPLSREVMRDDGGTKRWFRLDTFPLREESGAVTSAIEVVREVSAFKNLRSSLESEQRKMAAVLRGMGETLYIVSRNYDLQFFHRGDFPLDVALGGEAGGRKCHRSIFRRELPCPWCRMPETSASGTVERRVASLSEAGGGDHAYQVTFSPSGAGQGEQGSVVCLLVDISAQKRVEQQMILSEKLNSLSILSAGMAHELNNPLGAINFNLEILKRRERDREYQDVLESIRKDVLRINRIVGNLLSFSRSGTAASSGCLDLPKIIDDSLEIFQVVIERRSIEVRRAWPAATPQIWGNAQDLQQVFINLIANAIDAMPSGGAIAIAVDLEEQSAVAARSLVVVVYDDATDLAQLRPLMDVPEWDVRFCKGDGEAIDFIRQNPGPAPEVLILDYADPDADRVGFFVMMARECALEVRVLVIAGRDAENRPLAAVPGVSGVLARPLGSDQVMERVRQAVAGAGSRQSRPPEVVVRFSDTGVGITPEVQERIFDPFFTTKDVKGTGLGLSVVHKILEYHGASIRVSSTPGQGTQFLMRFPQARDPGVTFRMHGDDASRRLAW